MLLAIDELYQFRDNDPFVYMGTPLLCATRRRPHSLLRPRLLVGTYDVNHLDPRDPIALKGVTSIPFCRHAALQARRAQASVLRAGDHDGNAPPQQDSFNLALSRRQLCVQMPN